MMRLTHVFILLMAASLLPSCATMVRGVNDRMIVDTDPPGAKVTTDRKMGKNDDGSPRFAGCDATPCTIKIPRRSEFLMTIEKDGFEPVEIGVTSSMQKEALRSNLAATGKAGLAFGVTTAGAFAGLASSTGALAAGSAAVAGVATAGLFGTTLIVDGASGALLNLNPNPIILELPPEGTEVIPHDKAVAIREKRMAKSKTAGERPPVGAKDGE